MLGQCKASGRPIVYNEIRLYFFVVVEIIGIGNHVQLVDKAQIILQF